MAETEHICRVREASEFKEDSFFRDEKETESGKKYEVVNGRLASDDSIQTESNRYPASEWSEEEARSECKKNNGLSFEPAGGNKEAPDSPEKESPKDPEPSANSEELSCC